MGWDRMEEQKYLTNVFCSAVSLQSSQKDEIGKMEGVKIFTFGNGGQ